MVSFTVFKGSSDGKIVKSTSSREIGPDEVLVRITHSGVCGTDEHSRHADIVLGHEGAGVVEEIGCDVKTITKGESVGWGYLHSCCMECKYCLTGIETLCPHRKTYGRADLDQGSFGSHAVWREAFLFKIPSSIDRRDAAPLMCGGATVFNALQQFGVKSTDRVGIIGVGGLGHLAIQFAAKMGCDVVVFSSTESKREQAMKLGAGEFFATKGVPELKIGAGIDHLLVTTSRQPDWLLFCPIMSPGGTIYPLTVSKDDLRLPYRFINSLPLRLQGSLVAPRQIHRDMLTFAARHRIRPIVEEFPMTQEGIEECMDKLERGEMKYRGVLVAE